MIETERAVEEIEAIAAVEGVDSVLIGPHDLAGGLGCRADASDPAFAAALRRIEKAVTASGKALGGIPLPGLALPEMLERGYRFITCGSDIGFLRTQILDNLAQVGLPPPRD
jgi:2-keto-3-deoxy-L-rhamnonate aldolase RhmA